MTGIAWILYAFLIISFGVHYVRELMYLNEKVARIKDDQRRNYICDFRENLLDTMADNDKSNLNVVKYARGNSSYPALVTEYETKSNESLALFRTISFNSIYESDKPVEFFYPEEVLDKLIWKFDSPNFLGVENNLGNVFTTQNTVH